MPEPAFIALGSNIEPALNLPRALDGLADLGVVEACSRVYATAAVGPAGQPDFLNAAVRVATELEPLQLRARLRTLEAELGRVRTADRYAPRPIDLDLCLWGARVLETPELTLPDPDILLRPYLAVTLAEVGAGTRHPITGESLAAIAARLGGGDELRVHPLTWLKSNQV